MQLLMCQCIAMVHFFIVASIQIILLDPLRRYGLHRDDKIMELKIRKEKISQDCELTVDALVVNTHHSWYNKRNK